MARGRGRGRGRSGGRGRGRPAEADEDGSEAEQSPKAGRQSATAGMMPPSDSDESDSEEEAPKKAAAKGGQNANAGLLPPSDSDEDSEGEDEVPPLASETKQEQQRLQQTSGSRKEKDEEVDPEQMARDMARLKLMRDKREQERLERIRVEGWDRYAPVSATNVRPDSVPTGRDMA